MIEMLKKLFRRKQEAPMELTLKERGEAAQRNLQRKQERVDRLAAQIRQYDFENMVMVNGRLCCQTDDPAKVEPTLRKRHALCAEYYNEAIPERDAALREHLQLAPRHPNIGAGKVTRG